MRRVWLLFIFSIFIGLLPVTSTSVYAAERCSNPALNLSYWTTPDSPIPENTKTIGVTLNGAETGKYYRLRFGTAINLERFTSPVLAQSGTVDFVVDDANFKLNPGNHVATVEESADQSFSSKKEFCGDLAYTVGYSLSSCQLTHSPTSPRSNEKIAISVSNAPAGDYAISVRENSGNKFTDSQTLIDIGRIQIDSSGKGSAISDRAIDKVSTKMDLFLLKKSDSARATYEEFCIKSIKVSAAAGQTPRDPAPPAQGGASIIMPGCTEGADNCTKAAGVACPNREPGIQTAIGCVPTDPVDLINRLLSFAIGAAGGIALLLMMFGSFEMVTSQGDPKNLQNGRERFVAALTGLLFILFSVVFLKIIGVDILGLDAVSKGVFGR